MNVCTVVLQVGFSKSQKETQRVEGFHIGNKVVWTKQDGEWQGKFVTPTAKRLQLIWYLARLECSTGDIIRLETSVFLRGAGFDEDRTRIMEFLVDESVEPTTFEIKKVGDPNFPLVSGRVTLVTSRSKLDDRREDGEHLIREAQ